MQVKQSTDTAPRRAFGIVELARAIGVSPGFLRLEIARGNLKVTRLGRRVLITSGELERYLAAGTTNV